MQLKYGLLGLLSLSTVTLGNGFYVGGQVGQEWFTNDRELQIFTFAGSLVARNTVATGFEDWPLGAHVGYHFDLAKRGLLDLEVGAQWLPTKYPYYLNVLNNDQSTNIVRYRARRSFTFLVLPGIEYKDVDYQMLFGAALTKFTRNNYSTPIAIDTNSSTYSKSANPGVLVGAKVSTAIDPSLPGLKLSGTYYYSYYRAIDTRRVASREIKVHDQFQSQTALLGLDYVFGTPVNRFDTIKSAGSISRFYLGGEFGYNYTILSLAFTAPDGSYTNQAYALQGITGGVYGGDVLYTSQAYHLNISLEGFYHASGSSVYDDTSTAVTTNVNYKLGQNYGFTLNPGVWISHNYLLYALIGPMWADVKNGGNAPRLNGREFDKTVMGLRVGAGVSTCLYHGDQGRQLRLRMQYAYGDMSSVKLTDNNGNQYRYQYGINDYTLGLGYYF